MDEELNIQDYLKSLLDGEQSPDFDSEKWYYLYHINKLTNIEIGEIHCYTLKLFHSLKHYFSESSKVDMIPRIDFEGEYKIINELIVDYAERSNPKIVNFISAKEISKEDSIYCTYDSLYYSVIESKTISEYDVNYYEAIAYNDIFKLKLYIFKDKISRWSLENIRYKYYELTLPKRIEKSRIDLEKACTKKEIDNNLAIISFYINKFKFRASEEIDINLVRYYELFVKELKLFKEHLVNYFNPPSAKSIYGKLTWNGSEKEFFDFFDPMIKSSEITYNGKNEPYSIYRILLSHINIPSNDSEWNFHDIVQNSSLSGFDKRIEPDLKEKLDYKHSRDHFTARFCKLLNHPSKDGTLLLYDKEYNRDAISIGLHNIFKIMNQKRGVNQEIKAGSLKTAFKKYFS